MAVDHFLMNRLQHPDHGVLDFRDQLINDIVKADLHLFLLGQFLDLGIGPDVEPDDDGLGGRGQHDIGLGNRPGGRMEDADLDLRSTQFIQGLGNGLDGTLDIGLEYEVEFLDLAFLDLFIELFQGNLAGLGEFGLPLFLRGGGCRPAWPTLVLADHKFFAGHGHPAESRGPPPGWTAGPDPLSGPSRCTRPGLCRTGCRRQRVAGLQGPPLDEHRGHRAPPFIQPGFHHAAHCRFVGLAFSSRTSAWSRIISSRWSTPWPVLAETSAKMVSPPQSSEASPFSANCRLIRSGLALGLSILLMATMIGTPAARE